MTFENFKSVLETMHISSVQVSQAYDIGLNVFEFTESYHKTISLLLDSLLTSDGKEWVEWFLYEKNYIHDKIGRSDLKAYHEYTDPNTGKKIKVEICKDLENLYEYLKENNYFKCESQK
jgi:hypothetical protein